jgi:outer membrane protein assembly factor BamD (BamD/ComL family)
LGEKAQFYLAETQFQARKYVAANDSFQQLFHDYPGTEFLDQMVSREYALAQLWLAQHDPKAPPEQKLPWYSRFTGQQPLIDTRGMGLKALEHVRHHDPTGPLADDAVLQIADYHMAAGDYESAALYYDQLISDHPKSPFLQRAQLAAIEARLKAYLGPDYDGEGLEKARELVKVTLASFPDRQASYEKLYHTLDLINDQEAERTYRIGDYYRRIGKVASAEFYLGKIPQRWPSSPWAVKAKADLAKLAKLPRTPSKPSTILTQPGANDPYLSAGPMGPMGAGMGMMPGGMF